MNAYHPLCLFVLLGSSVLVHGGAFINLDFTSPDLSHLQYDAELDAEYGLPSDVVPGWTITQDGLPIDRVWVYNKGNIAPVTLSIYPDLDYHFRYNGNPLPTVRKSTTLVQTGTIPEEAAFFEFFWSGRDNNFDTPLHINGEIVPIYFEPLTSFDYKADVSRWAGQEVTLSFEFPAGTSGYLKDLRFTVPEPSTWALLGCGALSLALAGRPRRREEHDAPGTRMGTLNAEVGTGNHGGQG